MKVWCFDDADGWGKGLFLAARNAGHAPILFDDPMQPDEGVAFVHMHHHPIIRNEHKRMMQKLSLQPGLMLLPGLRGAEFYDDKIQQARHLAKWMPRTRVFHSPSIARSYLETQNPFPFYSKAAEGTNSYNIRYHTEYEAAKEEIRVAFSDRGVKCRYGHKQIGYLMWQEAIPHEGYSYRIVGVGKSRLVLKRYETGKNEAINYVNEEIASALALADKFFEREGLPWCAVDIIRHKETGRWYVLECSVGWPMESLANCKFIEGNEVMKERAEAIWATLIREIDKGNMGDFMSYAA